MPANPAAVKTTVAASLAFRITSPLLSLRTAGSRHRPGLRSDSLRVAARASISSARNGLSPRALGPMDVDTAVHCGISLTA
jgi:hypothetical protein